jgi:hypothetical protein
MNSGATLQASVAVTIRASRRGSVRLRDLGLSAVRDEGERLGGLGDELTGVQKTGPPTRTGFRTAGRPSRSARARGDRACGAARRCLARSPDASRKSLAEAGGETALQLPTPDRVQNDDREKVHALAKGVDGMNDSKAPSRDPCPPERPPGRYTRLPSMRPKDSGRKVLSRDPVR